MPKRTAISATLDIDCYEKTEAQAVLEESEIARALDRLNMMMTDLAKELKLELRFDVQWSNTIKWSLDRPADHPKEEDE